MKIVVISDVHGKWNKLKIPKCDLLISAGDYSFRGEKWMVRDFHKWLDEQDATHIISVQGNHEKWVEENFELAKSIAKEECPIVHFIDEGLIEIDNKKIWCSAITPYFSHWAWNRFDNEIVAHWAAIPDLIDLLVTHGPPFGYGDTLAENGSNPGAKVGCPHLRYEVEHRVKPKYHVFGHIHEGYGIYPTEDTTFINASICNQYYKPTNEPIVFELH